MTRAILILAAVMLAGCGQNGALNLSPEIAKDGLETATKITGSITDVSAQKEAIYYHARENRDKMQKQMYAQSGFNVKFKLVEVSPGIKIQMMEEVSFKEQPRFDQPLPNGPSEHPAWRFGEKLVDKGFDTLIWWTGINGLVDFGKSSVKNSSPQYYGDYNPQTAPPYIVNPVVVTP